eukprot:1332787-Karenia_brevis.AAC.1
MLKYLCVEIVVTDVPFVKKAKPEADLSKVNVAQQVHQRSSKSLSRLQQATMHISAMQNLW